MTLPGTTYQSRPGHENELFETLTACATCSGVVPATEEIAHSAGTTGIRMGEKDTPNVTTGGQ